MLYVDEKEIWRKSETGGKGEEGKVKRSKMQYVYVLILQDECICYIL